ncbi:insulinase family protein [Patescibacteria group bacterium]|nr:insulinase family protein [Patescibacteria group bacterium]
MLKKATLKNGLRIITVPQKNSRTVTFLVLVGNGSKYESKDINGISHFLEHMFFKGTQNRPNTLAIAETLDKVGGEYNAFTSKEVTGFWAKVDSKHQDLALDWLSDIFQNSKLDSKEIEREKGVVIEEMNMYLDTPTAYVGDLWEELLYKDQPAGWKIIGKKEHVLALNRDKVLDYFASHYSCLNTVICAAGDIKNIEKKIEKAFNKISKVSPPRKPAVIEEQREPGVLVHFKKTDQTHLCLGVRAYNIFHKDKYAVKLLAVILGGNMSSRLFISIRERQGLAYYIKTMADQNPETGFLMTQAGVDNKNADRAIESILKEYKRIKEGLITEAELQKAKDYIRGSMSLSLESSDSQAFFYAGQEIMEKEILTLEQIGERIDQVKVNDIKKVAEDIFKSDKLNLALIGPFKEKEKFKEILCKIKL